MQWRCLLGNGNRQRRDAVPRHGAAATSGAMCLGASSKLRLAERYMPAGTPKETRRKASPNFDDTSDTSKLHPINPYRGIREPIWCCARAVNAEK